ncbi:MAG: hypothetical protein R2764_00410 [Bacteroidales bacterium]
MNIDGLNEEDRIREAIKDKTWNEQMTTDSWAVFKIMSELVDGFETLSKIGPCVSIFGSARTKPDHPYYRLAEEIAYNLTKRDLERHWRRAGHYGRLPTKGLILWGEASVGLNIALPFEQVANPLSIRISLSISIISLSAR